ncbi:phosphotransferase [Marinitenerispora sediminis]|nr:phosphotransferase [Marinitenerispora sediminis]RCV56378.1 phosphotransferase [Marinitenerispora sediminis]
MRWWEIEPTALTYVPVGFGDHHWSALDGSGRRWFVTAGDLEHKEHCGASPEAARRGLRAAMDTAAALREREGLEFVLAPLRDAGGETVRPAGERYAVSVFPFVDGAAGDFGGELTPDDRAAVIDILADLHRRTPPASTPSQEPQLSARATLERALAEADRPWRGGAFAEPARALVAGHAAALRVRLDAFDELVAQAGARRGERVVTHGEPHAGNLLRSGGRLLLVDWDTVGLAVPERDLWLVAADSADLERYADAAGRRPDPAALELYRLRWALEDVATYVGWFRAPHERTPDTELAWSGFAETLRELAADGPVRAD